MLIIRNRKWGRNRWTRWTRPLQARLSSCSAGQVPADRSLAVSSSAHSDPSAGDISSFCHQAATTISTVKTILSHHNKQASDIHWQCGTTRIRPRMLRWCMQCSNQSISPAGQAHTSKTAAMGLLLLAYAGTDRQADGQTDERLTDAYSQLHVVCKRCQNITLQFIKQCT